MTAAPSQTTVTIGTRTSKLALWQTSSVAAMLERVNPNVVCQTVHFITAGDKELSKPLPEIGGKGVFTQELERALGDGSIDIAVHSLKDLPTAEPEGLVLGAISERADARDVLISREAITLQTLPANARVGTSSPRRAAQLLGVKPDLEILPLRGNIDTRVRKALAGEYDAIVIAAAGVARLGLTDAIREHLSFDIMLPAPGQGALGIQCRSADTGVRALLQTIEDPACRAAVSAERAFLAALGGGCSAPVGTYARPVEIGGEASLSLKCVVAAVDGSRSIRVTQDGPVSDPSALGRAAALQALAEGAEAFLP